MANGSPVRPRSSGLFSGLLLISLGLLMLLWTYAHIGLGSILRHWWPLIFIVWGLVKFYERTVAQRQGRTGSWTTPGEIFLVVGVFCLVGVVIIVDLVREKFHDPDVQGILQDVGDFFPYDLDVSPLSVPPNARVQINISRGDVTVHSADESQINVTGKKKVRAWNEEAANKLAQNLKLELAKDGDSYVLRPAGSAENDSRFAFDLDVGVPKKSDLSVKTGKGDIQISDIATGVSVATRKGKVEISDTGGSVTVDTQGGDTAVSDTKGDVKISGKGGEVSVVNASGGFTLNGEFYGPIRAEKIAKGVRFISNHTDFTLTQLTGHMEIGSGNFEVVDAPGNFTLRTSSKDITVENPGGKVNVDNRNGNIELRYSSPPRDDIQVNNSSSGITLSLPSNTSFEIQADCHSCDIDSDFSGSSLNKTSTKSGDTHLEGKYGSGRTIKIILRTSYGSINIRKTS
jgi:hypothetical protein